MATPVITDARLVAGDAAPTVVPTVLALHGRPGQGATWDGVRSALGADFDVLAPDRPGHAGSELPAAGFLGNARWAVGLLDRAEVPRAVVLAHSWGAGVALTFASRFADRCAGLVLVAPIGPTWRSPVDRALRTPTVCQAAGTLAACGGWSRGWWMFRTEHIAVERELPGLATLVPTITAPTVVIVGAQDVVVPAKVGRDLADAMPDATLVDVGRVGHGLPSRRPGVIADAVRAVHARLTPT